MTDVAVPYTVLEGGVDGVADGRQNAVLSNWPKRHGSAYAEFTASELAKLLSGRRLTKGGNKAEQIARLEAEDDLIAAGQPDESITSPSDPADPNVQPAGESPEADPNAGHYA